MQKIKSLKSYNAALYYRLSEEDIDLTSSGSKIESDSISNQKLLISQYLKSLEENIEIYDSYVDDGFTGTNFERPGFKRLLEDINRGLITMVIVKDLSRIGRNYVEVGRYVKKIFPQFNVRFVSILDRFDSLTATPNDYNLLLPVKNFVNENYSRDISLKIRGSMGAMREAGINVSAHPPYGYRRSDADKNKLEIDDEAKWIIQDIFKRKLKGESNQQIADRLNEMRVPTPAEQKKSNSDYKTPFTKNYIPRWYTNTVIRILKNKAYIGTLEQGKRKRISYKVRKDIALPETDWIVCKKDHEPIISESDFNNVQRLLKMDLITSQKKSNTYLFSGFLNCGDCGKPMIRRAIKYKQTTTVFYICATYNKKAGCTRHSVKETDLRNIVLTTINNHVETLVSMDSILKQIDGINIRREELLASNDDIQGKLDEIARYKKLSASLYRDMVEGLISEDEFREYKDFYDIQAHELEQSVQAIKKNVDELLVKGVESANWIKTFKVHRNIQELNRNILIELVDKIIVYEDNRINIVFNYSDEYKVFESALQNHLASKGV